jgi:hypothetical protein
MLPKYIYFSLSKYSANRKTNPLVDVELAEDLSCVQKVLVVEDPRTS